MPGGSLEVEIGDDGAVSLTGPARRVFEGRLAPSFDGLGGA
jgi:diaminopimelate epimerase